MSLIMLRYVCLLTLMSLFGMASAHASEWRRVPLDPADDQVQTLTVHPTTPSRLFAATSHTLYESTDAGGTWHPRWHVAGKTTITRLALDQSSPTPLIATTAGVFGSFDNGATWERVFQGVGQEAHGTSFAFPPHQPGTVFVGTHGGLFISTDHGRHWKPVGLPAQGQEVIQVLIDPTRSNNLYVLTPNRLFVGDPLIAQWQHLLSLSAMTEQDEFSTELEHGEADEEIVPDHLFRALVIDSEHPTVLYLATSRGVQHSVDAGRTWRWLPRTGLGSRTLFRLQLHSPSPLVLYAATSRGIARYQAAQERWKMLTTGRAAIQVNDLAITSETIWAATDRGLYRHALNSETSQESASTNLQELLERFGHEPTIGQVREAAIRYAEVHPDKIARWRRQAALQALLPSVDLGLDRDRSKDTSIDEGSFPNYQLIQTTDRDAGVDVSLNWDLGELIWNDDQTSIDVRSKLMVQLREDIVDEVTRTYFERRRLQAQLLTSPPTEPQTILEKELRLQELTALLDGLTGGYFSQRIHLPTTP